MTHESHNVSVHGAGNRFWANCTTCCHPVGDVTTETEAEADAIAHHRQPFPDPGCRVTDNGPCVMGLHIDEHLLDPNGGGWRHPDEMTWEDECPSKST